MCLLDPVPGNRKKFDCATGDSYENTDSGGLQGDPVPVGEGSGVRVYHHIFILGGVGGDLHAGLVC